MSEISELDAVYRALHSPSSYVLMIRYADYSIEEIINERADGGFAYQTLATDLPEYIVKRLQDAGVRVYDTMGGKWVS